MERYDLVVIGAGPAGLSSAVCAAMAGMRVVVFDENAKPGGQLFKQIHKFFGSKEHRAKIRGVDIGALLLAEATEAGARIVLNATVLGIFENREITVRIGGEVFHYKGDTIIIATGASENMIPFENWTLPGVLGAGAAQTLMNLHGVKPGNRALMIGSGNVGLVVGFQLMQAGCELVAVVDVADQVGGYGVHASKLTRAGVPLFTRHTILRALGENGVEGAVITAVGDDFRPIPNSEREIPVDTICVAVGLSPMSQLASMAGCDMLDDPAKSGLVPLLSETLETSVPGIFAAGDVSGIEEASSAMIEGRIAGLAAANRMGFLGDGAFRKAAAEQEAALSALRKGMFAPGNKGKKFERTDEGAPLSESLLARGFVGDDEIARYTAVKAEKAIRPVIECTQNIPCNPCQDVCPAGCIRVRGEITALPALEENMACTGCGLCVASCSGQAIFLVKLAEDGEAEITLPYEFLPLPREGDKGVALGRDGRPICNARVTRVKTSGAFDRTHLLTIRVPAEAAETARFFRKEGQVA